MAVPPANPLELLQEFFWSCYRSFVGDLRRNSSEFLKELLRSSSVDSFRFSHKISFEALPRILLDFHHSFFRNFIGLSLKIFQRFHSNSLKIFWSSTRSSFGFASRIFLHFIQEICKSYSEKFSRVTPRFSHEFFLKFMWSSFLNSREFLQKFSRSSSGLHPAIPLDELKVSLIKMIPLNSIHYFFGRSYGAS